MATQGRTVLLIIVRPSEGVIATPCGSILLVPPSLTLLSYCHTHQLPAGIENLTRSCAVRAVCLRLACVRPHPPTPPHCPCTSLHTARPSSPALFFPQPPSTPLRRTRQSRCRLTCVVGGQPHNSPHSHKAPTVPASRGCVTQSPRGSRIGASSPPKLKAQDPRAHIQNPEEPPVG